MVENKKKLLKKVIKNKSKENNMTEYRKQKIEKTKELQINHQENEKKDNEKE